MVLDKVKDALTLVSRKRTLVSQLAFHMVVSELT